MGAHKRRRARDRYEYDAVLTDGRIRDDNVPDLLRNGSSLHSGRHQPAAVVTGQLGLFVTIVALAEDALLILMGYIAVVVSVAVAWLRTLRANRRAGR